LRGFSIELSFFSIKLLERDEPMTQIKETRWYVIVNPAAGHGLLKNRLKEIIHFLNTQQITMEIVHTEYRKHAITLVQSGIQKGFRKIIAIGGDGTNNEVVNGIMQQNVVASTAITYCLLPVGTGNDWIKEYQIPTALSKWAKMLKAGNHFLQDVGLVDYHQDTEQQQRYFTNVAGMAYDPFVLSEMEKLKRPVTSRLGYLLYGLYYVFKYQLQRATVRFNGQTIRSLVQFLSFL